MSSRSQHYGFQSATMVQPANGGHAYLFGNNGSENDLSEEDGESYELRPRGRERLRRSTSRERMDDIIYLTRDIQEGDTLNSIALQYHCTVRLCSHLCVSIFAFLLELSCRNRSRFGLECSYKPLYRFSNTSVLLLALVHLFNTILCG